VSEQYLLLVFGLLLGGSFVAYLTGRLSLPTAGTTGSGRWAGAVAAVFLALAIRALWPVATAVWGGDIPTIALGDPGAAFCVNLTADAPAVMMSLCVLVLGLLVAIFSVDYMNHDVGVEKYHALLLLMVTGMVGLSMAGDLFNLFVCFELMTVASYVLVAFRKETWEPIEAGFKYIVISAVGSALALLGIALTFAYTGELGLSEVAGAVAGLDPTVTALIATLFIAGFGIKAAMVPLHTWLPDAHAAAPSGISAMLSGVLIQTGFFAMLRVLMMLFGADTLPLGLTLALFAVLTMTIGNLGALLQRDLKRMLAFSSVAQMGYILLGVGLGMYYAQAVSGISGGLFHIMTHAGMKGLGFLCAGVIIHQLGTRDVQSMRGLAARMPLTAACFTIAGLALAGVPPFSGFMSKWLIYKAGVEVGSWVGYTFTGVAIANSIISLGYYLPVIGAFYAKDRSQEVEGLRDASFWSAVPIIGLALVTIVLGVYPQLGLGAVTPAVEMITRALGGL